MSEIRLNTTLIDAMNAERQKHEVTASFNVARTELQEWGMRQRGWVFQGYFEDRQWWVKRYKTSFVVSD